MRITRARLRPRSGGRVPSALAELALPALTVVSGLQPLRLMVATVVSVYRDRLGAPLAGLTDAFAAAGGGPADELTWRSGDLAATGFVATNSTASDHRGIAVTIR